MRGLAAVFFTCFPLVASAGDTARVLSLCLDVAETPESRVAALESDGWQVGGDPVHVLSTALTLTRINSGEPSGWNDAREVAKGLADKALRGSVDTVLVESPDQSSAVFVGRDSWGLQTCLFLGATMDLRPVDEALDGSLIRTIGEVSRIRGDGVKSLISAHGITEVGRALFDPPLAYGMSFATQLDRQPGD